MPPILHALALAVAVTGAAHVALADSDPSPSSSVHIQRCQVHVTNRVLLAVERDGIIQTVTVREGDVVEQDQDLVRLRDDIARKQLELAEARAVNQVSVEFSRVAADVAKTSYDAALELEEQNAMSALQLRQRKLEYERGLKMIEQAEFDLRIAALEAATSRAILDSHGIRAPFRGTVTRVFKRAGESAQIGEPVIELVNTDQLQVEGYGLLQDLWGMASGASVQVRIDAPELTDLGITDHVFHGKLILVDSVVQPVTGMVRVIAEVNNENEILRDGMKVHLIIHPQPADDAEAPTVGAALPPAE